MRPSSLFSRGAIRRRDELPLPFRTTPLFLTNVAYLLPKGKLVCKASYLQSSFGFLKAERFLTGVQLFPHECLSWVSLLLVPAVVSVWVCVMIDYASWQ